MLCPAQVSVVHAGNRPSICARPDQLMGNINGSFGKGFPLSSDVNTNVIDARVAILCSSREVAKTALPNTPNWKGNTSAKDSVGVEERSNGSQSHVRDASVLS